VVCGPFQLLVCDGKGGVRSDLKRPPHPNPSYRRFRSRLLMAELLQSVRVRSNRGFLVYLTPFISSSLNGSHGEWTASDDVFLDLPTRVTNIIIDHFPEALVAYDALGYPDAVPDIRLPSQQNTVLLQYLGPDVEADTFHTFDFLYCDHFFIVHLCPVWAPNFVDIFVVVEYTLPVLRAYTRLQNVFGFASIDHPLVLSDLNGANGEVTGVDDHGKGRKGTVDGGLEQLAGNKGRQFITQAAKFQKPVNGLRDVDNASRRVAGKPKVDKLIADPPPVVQVAEEPSLPDVSYVVSSPGGYFWTGKEFASLVDGVGAVTDSGGIYLVTPPDVSYDNVVNSGPGYFTVSGDKSKGVPSVSRCCTKILSLPDDVHRQVVGFSCCVLIPLLSSLSKDLPGEVKAHTVPGSLAIARSRFGVSHPTLLSDTCKAYVHQTYLTMQVGKSAVMAAKPLELSALDVRERMQITLSGECVFYEGPTKVYAVDCELPVDWIPRDRYVISSFGGALCDLSHNPIIYPTFVTPPPLSVKWYDTEFFRFVGAGCAPFVTYAESPVNTTQAFKRFLAARDSRESDNTYYANQAILLNCFSLDFAITRHKDLSLKALTNIKTSFEWLDGERIMRVGGGTGHTIPLSLGGVLEPNLRVADVKALPYRCADALFPLVQDFVENSGLSYLDLAVLKMEDVSKWAYFNVHMSKLTLMEPFLSREGCAEITHVKKKLRQWYVSKQEVHLDDRVMVKRLQAKVKRELGKFGKVPRFFVTYDAGSMYSNELPEFLKVCMDGVRYATFGGVHVITYLIAKPKSDSFSRTFTMALESMSVPDTLFVAIYSDDTLYSGNIGGVQFLFNVDISSCDCNQNSLIFYVLSMMMGQQHEDRALGLVEQCMKPVRVENPANPHEYFEIRMHGPLEGSGTTLTTPLNHTASYFGALSVGFCFNELMQQAAITQIPVMLDDIRSCISTGAAMVGHKVTTSFCGDPAGNVILEKAQFMKKSPMYTTSGKLVSTTNIGCVLRSLGLVQGDLLPEKLSLTPEVYGTLSWQQRSDRFTAGVMYGFKHEPSNPVLDVLRSRFLSGTVPTSELERVFLVNNLRNPELVECDDISSESVSAASFQARYGFVDFELDELLAQIKSCSVGSINSSRACCKIYTVDYEVGPQGV